MQLPPVTEPQRYRGLYVYDFGDWTALGYTAEEVTMLLESEVGQGGHVYKIVRATPDGGMELRGVPAERFQTESGMLFNRGRLSDASEDFEALRQLGEKTAPPGRAFLHLADRGAIEGVARYVTALIYPAEYEDEMAQWLLKAEYAGGDTVEGGPSHVSDYYAEDKTILRREQLWSAVANPNRTLEQLLGSVRQAVQR